MLQTDLSKFDTEGYVAGPKLKVLIWFFFNYLVMDSFISMALQAQAVIADIVWGTCGRGLGNQKQSADQKPLAPYNRQKLLDR